MSTPSLIIGRFVSTVSSIESGFTTHTVSRATRFVLLFLSVPKACLLQSLWSWGQRNGDDPHGKIPQNFLCPRFVEGSRCCLRCCLAFWLSFLILDHGLTCGLGVMCCLMCPFARRPLLDEDVQFGMWQCLCDVLFHVLWGTSPSILSLWFQQSSCFSGTLCPRWQPCPAPCAQKLFDSPVFPSRCRINRRSHAEATIVMATSCTTSCMPLPPSPDTLLLRHVLPLRIARATLGFQERH